jgi:hypothetical protein
MNLDFEVSLFTFRGDFLHIVKSYDTRPPALLLSEEFRAADFCRP